jgi:nucleotide-binding universal stress UspA family protein
MNDQGQNNWLQKQCVIVPVDFSPESFAALTPARAFVQEASQIHLLHVLTRLPATEPGVLWQTVSDRTRTTHVKAKLREHLHYPQAENLQISVVSGDPSTEIIKYAQNQGADLIIMPSHGRTGLDYFLRGSVAERVVRFSHCPVLVLRGI